MSSPLESHVKTLQLKQALLHVSNFPFHKNSTEWKKKLLSAAHLFTGDHICFGRL